MKAANIQQLSYPLPRPAAVLFDWDGTVVDSIHAILEGYNEVCRAFNVPTVNEKELHEVMAIGPARKIFEQLMPDKSEEALTLYYKRVPALREAHLSLMPDIRQLLDTLTDAGIKLGVVSNMNHTLLRDEMRKVGLYHYFQAVVGAGETPQGKPSPEPVYLAADRLGLMSTDLAQTWFVGDMEPDMRASAAAGCPFLLFDPYREKPHLRADHIISAYADLDLMAKQILAAE